MNIIGADIGYGYTKLVAGGRHALLPSVIGPAVQIKYHNDLIGNGHGVTVQIQDRRWFVGDLARLQSPFTVSPRARDRDPETVRVLLLAALHRLGIAGDVKLVTGLPVSWYTDREQLQRHLEGPHLHTINDQERRINISDILVIPQPFGSFFRMLINGAGRLPDESISLTKQRVAVIDVGTHTTDYALADALRYVEPKSGSIEVAMGRVYELVQRAVGDQIREIDFQEAEEATRAGEILVRGRQRDVRGLVREAVAQVGAQIVGQARTLWGTGDDLANVLITGGGAETFLKTIRAAYPHAHLMPDAQVANADGFYRYGVFKLSAQ